MFLLTPHCGLILGVLEKTGCLSRVQAERLLSAAGAKGGEAYAERVLSRLAHMQKLRPAGDDIVRLPHLTDAPPDTDMLFAIDVMLDVSGGKPLALKLEAPPYKLCFLVETEKGVGSYAISVVPRGREAEVNFAFCGQSEKRVRILLLENEAQRKKLGIPGAHFFALRENERIRYFAGNAATRRAARG
jgi:hypothetical protein